MIRHVALLAVEKGDTDGFYKTVDAICEYLLGPIGEYRVQFKVQDLRQLLFKNCVSSNITGILTSAVTEDESYCWDKFSNLFTSCVRYYRPYIDDYPLTWSSEIVVVKTEYNMKSEWLIEYTKTKEYLESLTFLNLK